MSGGWLSGVCYPALVFVTALNGFRYIFVRVPWQRAYLAIFSAFLGTVGESFIIDTDHWRHFWMMLGVMWGMYVAAERYKAGADRALKAPASASWRRLCLRRIDQSLERLGRLQHRLVAFVAKRSSNFSSASE